MKKHNEPTAHKNKQEKKMSEEIVATKQRKTRPEQALVIGQWVDGSFCPLATQPEKPVTLLADMLTWAKTMFGTIPGSYDFVRRIPGRMVVVSETKNTVTFA